MLEDVRRNVLGFVEASMASMSEKLSPAKAREVARGLVAGEGPRQVNRVTQDLLEWSQRSREWITDAVSREVKRQLSALGIATREDLDALRKRVRELERSGRPSGPKGASTRGASGTKRGARKSPAKRSTARRSPAKATPPETTPVEPRAPEATGLGDPGASTP